MFEFFEKNLGFLIIVSIVGGFVIYSVKKEERENKKKAAQNKTEKSQKKEGEVNGRTSV